MVLPWDWAFNKLVECWIKKSLVRAGDFLIILNEPANYDINYNILQQAPDQQNRILWKQQLLNLHPAINPLMFAGVCQNIVRLGK